MKPMLKSAALPGTVALSLALALAGCESPANEAGEDQAMVVEQPSAVETPAPVAAAPAAATETGALLNPDIATREELIGVPGMDAATADAIVAGRPYANMTDVDRALAGRLNEEQREAVYRRVWRPIDLNTATGEEILLIPGVGDRMRHEFEEYRPYRAIEQFRREIGKYVDNDEVARLERYVVVR